MTPDQQAIVNDCVALYLQRLPPQLRQVAELHLAGLDKHDIAARINRTARSVERKLKLLRDQWRDLVADSVHQDVAELLSSVAGEDP